MKKNIVIFASGSGSNAENLILSCRENNNAVVVAIFCNNRNAGVIDRAERLQIPCVIFDKKELTSKKIEDALLLCKPDLIVLAGFLQLFPSNLIVLFANKIINIHPALLPKYGGKGMYGMKVHDAVIANKETESGITIHYVNEHYDDGQIIFQAKVEVHITDSAETLAEKIHVLEYEYLPKVCSEILESAD